MNTTFMEKIIKIPIKNIVIEQDQTFIISHTSHFMQIDIKSQSASKIVRAFTIPFVSNLTVRKHLNYEIVYTGIDTYSRSYDKISKTNYPAVKLLRWTLYIYIDPLILTYHKFPFPTLRFLIIKSIRAYASMYASTYMKILDENIINRGNINSLIKFILDKEKIKQFLIHDYDEKTYILDENYAMVKNEIVEIKNKKRLFRYGGGIIAYANIEIIKYLFDVDHKTLVLLPNSFKNTWSNTVNVCYDDIDPNNLDKFVGTWDRIICIEMHHSYRNIVKSVIEKCSPKNIWLIYINNIPYYASHELGDKFMSMGNEISRAYMMSILNIFMDLTNSEKFLMKKFLSKYIVNKFINIIYQYGSNYHEVNHPFKETEIKLNYIEKFIFDQYKKYKYHGKNILLNDQKNKIITSNIIDSTINQTCLNLISTSTNDISAINELHMKKINEEMTEYEKIATRLISMDNNIKRYTNKIGVLPGESVMHQLKYLSTSTLRTPNKKYIHKIITGSDTCKKIVSRGTVFESHCMICYNDLIDEDNIINPFMYTLCGHTFCPECYINSQFDKSTCPICNYFLNSKKNILVQKTNNSDYLNLLSELNNVDDSTLTISMFDNLKTHNNIIYFVNEHESFNRLSKLPFSKITKINVLMDKSKEISNIVLINFLFQIYLSNKKNIQIKLFSIKDFE